MTMPFGKYTGFGIDEVPDDYLDWLLTIDIRPSLRRAVIDETVRRAANNQANEVPPVRIAISPQDIPLARRVFDEGYRAVARKVHPDSGGNVREMQALNLLAESFRLQLSTGGAQ